MDMDVPYALQNDYNSDGVPMLRIIPQSDMVNRNADYDICLEEHQVKVLIRTLQFLLGEIK